MDRARRRATNDRMRIGMELRVARMMRGRSIEDVAQAVGMSPSQVGRIERGVLPSVGLDQLARLGAVVQLDVRVHAYPGPDATIDAGQRALLGRLMPRLHGDLTLRLEVPLPIAGDQRAWDGMIGGFKDDTQDLPVEAETQIVDLQAQIRRILLKGRDAGSPSVLVVVADTHRNRAAVAGAGSLLSADFPTSSRQTLRALAEGRRPPGSALILL